MLRNLPSNVPPPREKPPLEYKGICLTTHMGKITQVSHSKNKYMKQFLFNSLMTTSAVANEFSSNRHQNITCSFRRTQTLIHSIYSNIGTCLGRIMTIIRLPTENDNHWATNTKSQSKS
jgi:hypothetical protein